ncbi:MAG: tetrahydromethanopterin S-methyltransferase subunit H, partial [Candidatus Bathyarchaeia archaeon]
LAFNPRKPTVEGRMEILSSSPGRKGLIDVASEAGVEKPLVDVSVLDVPDVGPAAKAVFMVKEKYGLPSGCAPANAIDMWRRNRSMDAKTFLVSNATAHSTPAVVGADFIMYGPISRAPYMYQAVALVDALVAYSMRQQYRMRPLTRDHPLYKIF